MRVEQWNPTRGGVDSVAASLAAAAVLLVGVVAALSRSEAPRGPNSVAGTYRMKSAQFEGEPAPEHMIDPLGSGATITLHPDGRYESEGGVASLIEALAFANGFLARPGVRLRMPGSDSGGEDEPGGLLTLDLADTIFADENALTPEEELEAFEALHDSVRLSWRSMNGTIQVRMGGERPFSRIEVLPSGGLRESIAAGDFSGFVIEWDRVR